MRINPLLVASFLLTVGCCGSIGLYAQNVYSLDANLPPVLSADAGPNVIQPTNIFNPIPLGGNPSAMGGNGSYSYAWLPATGLDNSAAANPNIVGADTSQAFYGLTITDGNNCVARDTVYLDYILRNADPNVLEIRMTVLPNPSDGRFTLSLRGKPTGKDLRLVLSDALGRQLHDEQLDRFSGALEKRIDLSGYGSGVYFLGLRSGGKQVFEKIVVQ